MSFIQKIINTKEYFLAVIIFLCVLIGFFTFFQIFIDDAFIFYRYGYNLVNHGIWNWHNNTNYTEAYTSFVIAALTIVPALFHFEPLLFFKFFGAFFFFFIIYRLFTNVKDLKMRVFAVFIFVANWHTYVHAFSSLETLFWVWLLLEVFIVLSKETITTTTQIYLWILCLLLPLTRPEGVVFAAFAFFYVLKIKKEKLHVVSFSIVLLIGLLYFIWRYQYFQLLLPLPFYHKSVTKINRVFTLLFNTYTSWQYILSSVLVVILLRKDKLFLYLSGITFFLFFFLYAPAILAMNYADRFSFQLFFPLILFAFIKIDSQALLTQAKVKTIAFFLILLTFSEGIYNNWIVEMASIKQNAMSTFIFPRAHYALAKHINRTHIKGLKVLFGDAGIFPYYANVETIDAYGLCDNFLSRNKLNETYFNNINPDIILIGYLTNKEEDLNNIYFSNKQMYEIIHNPKYAFQYLGYAINTEDGYFVHVYINPKTTHFTLLKTALSDAIKDANEQQFDFKKFAKFEYLTFYKEK
ncbi:MAG TPA: hypothetical protein PK431_01905 [Chitinophagales bacterium]|nr:hypothetical protein [Chitinophagales bacterium]